MNLNDNIDDKTKINWLRLIRTPQIGPINFYRLMDECDHDVIRAINELPEISKRRGHKNIITPYPENLAIKEYKNLKKAGGNLLLEIDPRYPDCLRAISDRPPLLSYIGDVSLLSRDIISIVGARNASLNGQKFAGKISGDLGKCGYVIASGFARGIDTAAHESSINTGTIAVMAGGIDIIYPHQNKKLYDDILSNNGLIVAESPFSTQPMAKHFPRRNRIVSGLSKGVIVIESTLKSGSLITARLAAEQGREVCAVPGFPLDPRSAGTNKLIRDGATLVRSADDVVETLSTPVTQMSFFDDAKDVTQQNPELKEENTNKENIEDTSNIIESYMSTDAVSVDELARTCNLNIPNLQGKLLEMELDGKIERLPGNRVCLTG